MIKILFLGVLLYFSYGFEERGVPYGKVQGFQDPLVLKAAAFKVLENKCNACHFKKKKIVFTKKNMSQHARAIHYQVFQKKRMPKGKVKLTNDERKALQLWLSRVNSVFTF